MHFVYNTKGVCARSIDIEIDENDIVKSVRFNGGCNGNTQGIAVLVSGMSVQDVINKLSSIRCNGKASSCPDQLAAALKEYKTKAGD